MKLGAHHITSVSSVKVLCIYIYIYIYDGLEWTEHINHVVKRISSGSYSIHSARRFLSTDNLRLIKKRCIRNVCNVSYNEHTSPLFSKLAIPNLEDIYKLLLRKLMYFCVHDKLLTPLSTMFSANAEIHDHKTRQRLGPHVQKRQTSKIAKTFIHQGPKLWSNLASELILKNSIKSFTNCLKKHLITQS